MTRGVVCWLLVAASQGWQQDVIWAAHYLVTIIDAKDHLGMDGMGWEMMNMNEFCEINKTMICDSDRCTMSRNQWKELLLT